MAASGVGDRGTGGCPGQLCCSISELSSKGICWDPGYLEQSAESGCEPSRDRRCSAQGPQTCCLETLPMNMSGLCISFSCWIGVWSLLCPHNSSTLGLAVLAWHTLSSVCKGSGLWRLSGSCLTPGHPLASSPQKKGRAETPSLLGPVSDCQHLTLSKYLLLHGLITYPVMKAAAILHLWRGGSALEGRAAGQVVAEVASCPDHRTWGPAPPTSPCGCASLPAGGTLHRCAWAVLSGHPPTASASSLTLWGHAVLAKGSARVGIPHRGHTALPWSVPLHGQSLWRVGGSVHGGLLQPHGMVPAAGLQPLPCTLL